MTEKQFYTKGYLFVKKHERILPVFLVIAIVVCLFTGQPARALDTYLCPYAEAVRMKMEILTVRMFGSIHPFGVTVTSRKRQRRRWWCRSPNQPYLTLPGYQGNTWFFDDNEVGVPYESQDSYSYDDPAPGYATYEGLSWMYFLGDPDDMPASSYSYPSVSLGNYTVNQNTAITLSYEYLIYIWQY